MDRKVGRAYQKKTEQNPFCFDMLSILFILSWIQLCWSQISHTLHRAACAFRSLFTRTLKVSALNAILSPNCIHFRPLRLGKVARIVGPLTPHFWTGLFVWYSHSSVGKGLLSQDLPLSFYLGPTVRCIVWRSATRGRLARRKQQETKTRVCSCLFIFWDPRRCEMTQWPDSSPSASQLLSSSHALEPPAASSSSSLVGEIHCRKMKPQNGRARCYN